MSKSLEELQIGTYANIAMVRTTTPVYVALGIFVQHRVSALPVVDEKGEKSGKDREGCRDQVALGKSTFLSGSLEGVLWVGSLGYHMFLAELPLSP
jgi:CBS domain-containing protein